MKNVGAFLGVVVGVALTMILVLNAMDKSLCGEFETTPVLGVVDMSCGGLFGSRCTYLYQTAQGNIPSGVQYDVGDPIPYTCKAGAEGIQGFIKSKQ